MRRALNAAAILCESHCFAPPGFVIEDQIAFELAENQQDFLTAGLIQLPMRENNLADFAEKKRIGYEPMRDRYSGLFSDNRISFLGRNAIGIVNRKTYITEGIVSSWESGPDSRRKIWAAPKKLLIPSLIDRISLIPSLLDGRGVAVTWSAILSEMPEEARAANSALRDTLQHIYFRQYCDEFGLIVLANVPHVSHHFALPTEGGYNYRYLSSFLSSFGLGELLFDAPASLIVELRKRVGFIAFFDAYIGLAKQSRTETDLQFFAGRAKQKVRYAWDAIASRRLSLYGLSHVEIDEITDVMEEVAVYIATTHGLPNRQVQAELSINHGKKGLIMASIEPELVLFVALEEELDVLARKLGFKKVADTPEAIGTLGGVSVAVICPRNMGRVAAAVAMTRYLTKRVSKPKLILVVGLAGGFTENNSVPGHIIVVTKVVDLALRKVVDEADGASPHFRREDYTLHDQLMKLVWSDSLNQNDWSARVCNELDWPADRRPSLHYGPMACADEVVASDLWRAEILKGKGGDAKLLGVEMEAGGVCEAARKANVPVSMVRVVSDSADPSKADDKWRKLGMQTLADLLNSLPIADIVNAIN